MSITAKRKEGQLVMSERNSQESTDMKLMGGRPINDDVEKTDLPSEGFSASMKYHSISKRKNMKQRPKEKEDMNDSWMFDVENQKWIESDNDIESLPEKSDALWNLPEKKEADEDNNNKKKDKINPYTLSEILIEIFEFVVIDDTLHCYDPKQGFWRCIAEKNSKDDLRKMIPVELRPAITAQTLSETYHWLKTESTLISNDVLNKRKDYLNFADGVFTLEK